MPIRCPRRSRQALADNPATEDDLAGTTPSLSARNDDAPAAAGDPLSNPLLTSDDQVGVVALLASRPPARPAALTLLFCLLQDEFLSQDECEDAEAPSDEDMAEPGSNAGKVEQGRDSGNYLELRAERFLSGQQWEQAINAYSAALEARDDAASEGRLLCGRAAAYCGLSLHLRSIPAAESECRAISAPCPQHLAARALRDADAALHLEGAHIAQLHASRGEALFLMERYADASEAFSLARRHSPGSMQLAARVEACRKASQPDVGAPDAGESAGQGLPCDFAALRSQALQDAECILCLKLLYEPVTTPCGHTFCRPCFARAIDHANKCPMCRTVLHVRRELPVSVVLKNLLERSFPEDYAARREEELVVAAAAAEQAAMPLFVMSLILPGEKMALNIFEPRYRLMVRRVMEGSRRFGMAALNRTHELCSVS